MTYIPKSPIARAMMERKLARQAAEAVEKQACVPAEAGISGGRAGRPETPASAGDHEGEGAPPQSEYPEPVEVLSLSSGTSSQESAAVGTSSPLRVRQAQGERDRERDRETPNLPALIAEIPSDDTRPAQTQFDLEAQTVFLEALATSGSVRSASRKARTSHQSVYRMRRASRPFRRAWDAALVVAREAASSELADRAMNGVEEEVYYHGEVIAKRRRYDSRLLLAHLARLDRLADTDDAAALAEDFDGMLERFGRGEDLSACVPAEAGTSGGCAPLPETPAFAADHERAGDHVKGERGEGAHGLFSQDSGPGGPCLSETPDKDAPVCPDCGGACDDPRAVAMGLLGPEDCQWLGNRLDRMNAARPEDAIKPEHMHYDMDEVGRIEALQLEAFEAEGHEWWLVTSEEELMESCTHGCEEEGEMEVVE